MTDEAAALGLDDLVLELARVREAGLEPLDVETALPGLPHLSSLGVVTQRTRADTTLGQATAICATVNEAIERLADEADRLGPPNQPSNPAQAQMLFRMHYRTRKLGVAEARVHTQELSGVGDRQFRARHEARLLRLVAQSLLDLDREHDLTAWGRAMEVGADVPQTVAMYWLYLFRDHYFRMETSAYALQFDLETALSQLRDDLPDWRKYLATAVYWNIEFSYLRHRFWRTHGPLWFAPTDEGCAKLNDAVERIEYHDPFPDEYMARLRRLYGSLADPDHDLFAETLARVHLDPDPLATAETWLRRCTCPRQDGTLEHADRCEVQIVLANCDIFGDTVEEEFTRIQEWYRNPRFAADPLIKDRILGFRTPTTERASVLSQGRVIGEDDDVG
ncbi:MAG: hypothetical protein IPK24_05690 [Kineosporiaceae bacterium]|nr:hypothetical protein [Kineosporiaceae bacterium]